MISMSACLQRRATDQLGPLESPRPAVSYTTSRDIIGVLREEGDFLVFASAYSFTSASSAAAAVIGASANGRILWKLPDGRNYADWESSQGMSDCASE